jgi:hypothetical protein
VQGIECRGQRERNRKPALVAGFVCVCGGERTLGEGGVEGDLGGFEEAGDGAAVFGFLG